MYVELSFSFRYQILSIFQSRYVWRLYRNQIHKNTIILFYSLVYNVSINGYVQIILMFISRNVKNILGIMMLLLLDDNVVERSSTSSLVIAVLH